MNQPQPFSVTVDEDLLRVVETNQCRRQVKGVPLGYHSGVLLVLDIESYMPIQLCEDQLDEADVGSLLEVMSIEGWHRTVATFKADDGRTRLAEARRMTESELERIKHVFDFENRRAKSFGQHRESY
jgi:hypothetical protein